ncbi:hypothetical protein Tco_1537745, partial [Tanacetum coccineum]
MFVYSSSSSRRKTQPHNASLKGIALNSRGINSSCRKQTTDTLLDAHVLQMQSQFDAYKEVDVCYIRNGESSPIMIHYVPKLNLDDVFEQKNEIARAVEDQLEK